jgi:hypothetical protein
MRPSTWSGFPCFPARASSPRNARARTSPTLRGRDRTALLAGIRAARTGQAVPQIDEATGPDGGMSIPALSAATLFDAAGDLAAIAVHPQETFDPSAMLRRLGSPPGFGSTADLDDGVARAAGRALRLAQLTDDGDPILEALRERGSASAAELGAAVGRPAADVSLALRPLVAAGVVYRTGHAKGTRYQA